MNYRNKQTDYLALPKPLSESEIISLFIKYNSGDKMAEKKIIKYNIRIVLYRVNKKFSNTSYDKNDLISTGIMGLIKAVNNFDINRNCKFSSYATRCIDNEILMFIRKENKRRHSSLNEDILDSDDNITLEDTICDEEVNLELNEEKKELYHILCDIIKMLPDRDKQIIMLHYGFINNKVYTQREIANIIGLTQSYISRRIKRIVNDIRNKLIDDGLIDMEKEKENIKVNLIPKKINTIYEYWNKQGYLREDVDKALFQLSKEDLQLIKIAYGDDLDNPVRSINWKGIARSNFYNKLIPKMKKILEYNRSNQISLKKANKIKIKKKD